MVAIAYFLPPVVCLFVFYVCGIDTPEPYAWILVSGWAAAGLTHRLCYRNRTKATEYLGAFIWGLFYEEPWTEREVIVETYTDKNGNTHERRRVVYTHHSEVFLFQNQHWHTPPDNFEIVFSDMHNVERTPAWRLMVRE